MPWSRSRRRSPDADADAPAEEERPDRIPCAQCGAELGYAPGTSTVRCAHCGHDQAIAASPWRVVVERDLAAALERAAEEHLSEDRRVLRCQTCAAGFDAEDGQGAGRCPFCGSAIVADPARARRICPDGVVPFAILREQAQDALRQWLAGLWFAPSDLSRRAEAEALIEGLYLPFWTYDCDTTTEYRGARGTRTVRHAPVLRPVQGRPGVRMQPVADLRWTPVEGTVARRFNDVLAPATRALPLAELGRAGAWNTEALRPYAPAWLAGFRSTLYDVRLADGFATAQGIMRGIIASDIRRDIGGDAQRITASRTAWNAPTFKHVLLPAWVAAYRYRGRTFRFVVNGQTGHAHGERPWSLGKLVAALLGAGALALLLALLAGQAG